MYINMPYACMYVCMHAWVYVCMYVRCMYVCMYICMCVCKYALIQKQFQCKKVQPSKVELYLKVNAHWAHYS